MRSQEENLPLLRFFSLGLMFFALYLCWVPSFSSLTQATGHVSQAGYTLTRFNATFTLDNRQTLRCTAKGFLIFGSQLCPALDLKKAFETQEAVTIFYSGQKVWGVESVIDKRKLMSYTSIRNTRWAVMVLICFVFLGIFFFAPALISPRYDRA